MEVDPPPAAPASAEPGSPPAVNPAPVAPRRIGHWQVDKQIGRGSFAVVWRARHAETGQRVAVKEIRLDKLNRKLRESLESEIQVLQRSRHGNIIRLHDIIKEEKRIFLVLEYCAGGDVSEFIKKHGRVREDVARHFMRQMASGLRAMRAQNLIHRDLKPQNLLLTVASPDAELKIADFGFARYMHPTGMAETLCGSPLYMAPEILGYQKYDAKADLWSVGTILYELLVGRPPFTGMNPMQLLRNIERSDAKIPSKVANGLSRECVSILRGLLRRNPVERMSFDEFFDHPFLTGQATIVRGGPPSETRREAGASGGGDAAGADSGMSGGDDTSGSGDSSQMPFPMEDDSTSTGTHATTTNTTTTTNRTNTTQRQQASVGGNPRPPPPAPTPTHLQHRHAHPPHVHHASIPSSVEKAARGVGNVAAAAAMGVRDVAAAAAAAGTNWLSTSPLSRRPGFLGGTSPGGGRPLGGSGSHQKPPLSSSPSVARAASFGGFTPGGDGVSVEIQPVPFSLQGSKARSGSDRSLNSMDAEYVLVEDDKSGGDKSGGLASMESSPGGSLPSGGGGGGGGLTQMAAGLTRRLSSNLGAVILGSSPPPSKFGNNHHHVTSSSSSPGRELYRMSSSPGGTGLGSGGSPGSFPPRPGSSRHSPPGMLGEFRNSPSYPSSRVSSARSGGGGGSGLALGAGASLAPSQSPSEKEAAAALALARVAQAAAAAAPGEKRFASAAQRVSVLERAATVLRDVAMERWDSGKKLDALSVSLVSLTALREGYKLAQAVAKEAAEAEACSNAPQGVGPLDGSRNVRLSDMSDSSRSSGGGGGGDCASRPASASSSSSGSPPWIPGRSSSSSQSGTIGSSAELPRLSSKTPERLRKDRERAVKTAERIKNAFNAALTRADRAAAAVKGVGVEGSAVLPDAMDLAYDAALALGRSGAVEELMGNTRTALEAYSRAQTLLVFILSEGPRFVTARDEQSGDERAATDAERETAAALVSAPGRAAGDGVETGDGSRLITPSVHPCDEFPARGRIARFVGAIGARQQACAATAMRSSSGATRRPP